MCYYHGNAVAGQGLVCLDIRVLSTPQSSSALRSEDETSFVTVIPLSLVWLDFFCKTHTQHKIFHTCTITGRTANYSICVCMVYVYYICVYK